MRHKTALLSVLLLMIVSLDGLVSLYAEEPEIPDENYSYIAFTTDRQGNQEIFLLNPVTSQLYNLTRNAANDWDAAWSPDGTRIAFVSDRDDIFGEIYVMDVSNRQVRRLTSSPDEDAMPAWSPDGTRIAFVSDSHDGNSEIHVIDENETNFSGRRSYSRYSITPAWFPDSQALVYSTVDPGYSVGRSFDLVFVNVGPNRPDISFFYPANSPTRDDTYPTWSTDGRRMAFTSSRDYNSEIYITNTRGTYVRNLTNHPSEDNFASWSPDGEQIAFASDRTGDYEIYVMNFTGSDPQRVTTNLAEDTFPAWSPWLDAPIEGEEVSPESTSTPTPDPNAIIATTVICQDSPPSRLNIGMQAIVVSTSMNSGHTLHVYDTPGGEEIARLPDGTMVNIIGGPECHEVNVMYTDIMWWEIQTPGGETRGWAVEGILPPTQYLLTPFTSPTPTPPSG